MQGKLRNFLTAVAILAAGGALSWAVIVLKPVPEPVPPKEPPPHIAQVIPVTLESRPIAVSSQGTVRPKIEIDITAQVSGEVIAVDEHFAAGGYFQAGEELLAIDPRDYEIALVRAEAALAEAKKALAQEEGLVLQARREWRDLGSQAANDLFLRKPQLKASQANLQAAEAGVRQARLDLERTIISLPFAGRVVGVDANLGQYVNKGSKIGSVFAADVMEVRLPLTAAEITLLNLRVVDQRHQLDPLDVRFYFQAGHESWEWRGRAVRVEAAVDSKSRLFYLVAEIASHPDRVSAGGEPVRQRPILPGTFVRAVITSNPHADVAVLPRSALYKGDQLLVLDADSRLQTQRVTVLQADSSVLVVRGLENGQQVLAVPPVFLDLGASYTPVPFSDGDDRA